MDVELAARGDQGCICRCEVGVLDREFRIHGSAEKDLVGFAGGQQGDRSRKRSPLVDVRADLIVKLESEPWKRRLCHGGVQALPRGGDEKRTHFGSLCPRRQGKSPEAPLKRQNEIDVGGG